MCRSAGFGTVMISHSRAEGNQRSDRKGAATHTVMITVMIESVSDVLSARVSARRYDRRRSALVHGALGYLLALDPSIIPLSAVFDESL